MARCTRDAKTTATHQKKHAEITKHVQETTGKFPKLLHHDKNRPEADPYTIAPARSRIDNLTGDKPTTVTLEGGEINKIPYVARECCLESTTLVGAFGRQGRMSWCGAGLPCLTPAKDSVRSGLPPVLQGSACPCRPPAPAVIEFYMSIKGQDH